MKKKRKKEGNEKQICKHGGHRARSCSLKIHDAERKPGRASLSAAIHHRVRLALQGGEAGKKKKCTTPANAGGSERGAHNRGSEEAGGAC